MSDHPSWCDPRLCDTDPGVSVEHRESPTTWQLVGDDATVTIGLTQIDGVDIPWIGSLLINLGFATITDPVEVDLTPADARFLGAALTSFAERAERHIMARDDAETG